MASDEQAVMGVGAEPADPQRTVLYGKVLGGDLGAAHLWFDPTVLEKYRGQPDWRVIRTNNAGRVRSPAGWSLDFGITADDRLIHATAADLSQRLPQAEQRHWAQFVVTLPVSRVFLTMRMGGGNCIDDGDIRSW